MYEILLFVFHGFLGAFLAVLLKAYSLKYLYSKKAVLRYILGAVIGYIYFWAYSEYNFPNGVMAIVAGYAGKDFIETLISKFKKA